LFEGVYGRVVPGAVFGAKAETLLFTIFSVFVFAPEYVVSHCFQFFFGGFLVFEDVGGEIICEECVSFFPGVEGEV
jgi:hypothetical protein